MVGYGLYIGSWLHLCIEISRVGLPTYPIRAGIDTPLPFAVYERTGIRLERDKSGVFQEIVGIAIAIYASTYHESIEYATNVRAALEKEHGHSTVESVFVGTKDGDDDGFILYGSITDYELVGTAEDVLEGDIWCQILEYEFTIENLTGD